MCAAPSSGTSNTTEATMGFLHDAIQYLVQIHQGGDWPALIRFYGLILAVILFIWLEVWLARGRAIAVRAVRRAGELTEDLRAVRAEVDELERRLEKRFDNRTSELDIRMTKKMDQKGDLIQERVEQRAASLSDTIHRLESRATRACEDVDRFRSRIDEVEGRIPNLFDRLDDFRDTLGRTFQVELNSVLSSFDSSLSAILQQMKADLQLGLSRVESLETMVRSRDRAQKGLLGTPEGAPSPLPSPLEEEEEEFAEWEEEAKELAGQGAAPPVQQAQAAGDEESVDGLLEAIPVEDEDEEEAAPEYPAEIADAQLDEDEPPPQ
jgi:hypothetical protein